MNPRFFHRLLACALCSCGFLVPRSARARPVAAPPPEYTTVQGLDREADTVGLDENGNRVASTVQAAGDTSWIADWSFDGPFGSCTSAGWTKHDLHILNDGSNYWSVSSAFAGQGSIAGGAANLGKHDLCWDADGYGNNWDYSIRVLYRGITQLDFDYKIDSEACCDFMTVEADSGCTSFSRFSYTPFPSRLPADYRVAVGAHASGTTAAGTSAHFSAVLPDFGSAGTTHCAYIRFAADGGCSHEDGGIASQFGAGLVVDNVVATGGEIPIHEAFEGALDPNLGFVNTSLATPFGEWARLYPYVTDNDVCTENTSCAWLWSDPTLIAVDPTVVYGPGSAVVHNWLDDAIVSPWVSLASTPAASRTLLSFRRFGGNALQQGSIVQNWSVRSKTRIGNSDTPAPGDSLDCVARWLHASAWSFLGSFAWVTSKTEISPYLAPRAREIQIRFRVSDWQLLSGGPPNPFQPGPGPYLDHIRIGRRTLSGPVLDEGLDARSQAQSCFATVPLVTGAGTGEHFEPGTDRFGTCAFSRSGDLKGSSNVITGDSISIGVADTRSAGGISSIRWYGVVVSGPHVGKVPAPYSPAANGFFEVRPESCRTATGSVVAGQSFVDLDDTYFRGGDVLDYFWTATDAQGGFTSDPEGLTALPASVSAAERATSGLLQVRFLPVIAWSPSYLARIAADAHGDLDPTPAELAASQQKNCILVDELVNFRRRSGVVNRTSLMYTLDHLGYHYDPYDQMGYGSTNNQLGGRASVAQTQGYAVIFQDNGRGIASPSLPDGTSLEAQKVDQAQWYRDWLANGSVNEIGTATLWIVSENTVQEKKTNQLIATDMGVTLVSSDQGLGVDPGVEGQTSFTFAGGGVVSFVGDRFALSGGCPDVRNFDGLGAAATAVITHRYKSGTTLGAGALVMNANPVLRWNTVMQSHAWFDIRDVSGGSPPSPPPALPSPEATLLDKVLQNVLPPNCKNLHPTGVTEVPVLRTALYQNHPNPFNPTTIIRFDLAQQGQVEIRIFDVAGHVVRILVNGERPAGRAAVLWNGQDDAGHRVASGIYLYRLEAGDYSSTRKLVVLR